MQAFDLDSNAADIDLAVNHRGPLASALDALRTSLDVAVTALKRFVRETESAQGSDLAMLDASPLHIARLQLHQAVGVLALVGLAGPSLVLRAMEAAVQKFVLQPEQCSQEAAAKIEHASFALTEHLQSMLADKPVSALSLFPQYRAVQELVKADRIHPADLWAMQWRWLEPELNASPEPRNYDTPSRTIFDQSVLQIMKGQAPQAAAGLKDLCLGLSARQADREPRIFWKIAAAYFEALAHGLLPPDTYVRRAASRVLLQYASLSKGDIGMSDRLAQDLLFFCSQATTTTKPTPILSAVRAVYGLAASKAVDYEALLWGRFDPALLVQVRRRLASAKETWSAVSAGDVSKFKAAADQFSLVTDCLVKLHPPSEPLALALTRAIDATARAGQAPTVELAMEVATSVQCLEAAFNDLDLSDAQLAARTQRLAERLEILKNSGVAQPLESWIEDLYRRASDKQTMGSVVAELRVSLGKLEKSMEIFLRQPQETSALTSVPGQLSHIRGVLSVLGLGQASHAVMRMRDSVEQLMATEFDEERPSAAGTVDQLANNLGALSFLIGMLNDQPALAKKLFVYDDLKGELRPLMGRAEKTSNLLPDDGVPASQIEKVDVDSLSAVSGAQELSPVAAQQFVALTLEPIALVLPEDLPTMDDEQVKVIGDLRMGVALYNLFLNDADESSRCLLAEVSEWAMQRDFPVSDAVVSFAHALTASSATVGFTALSEITRALEDALRLSQTHYSAAAAAQYADLFVDAAEDIRRLLHQFAAGFLKKSDPVLLSQLRALAFPDTEADLESVTDAEVFELDGSSDSPPAQALELVRPVSPAASEIPMGLMPQLPAKQADLQTVAPVLAVAAVATLSALPAFAASQAPLLSGVSVDPALRDDGVNHSFDTVDRDTPATAVGKSLTAAPQGMAMQPLRQAASASLQVPSDLLDRMLKQVDEDMITRSRLALDLHQLRGSLGDITGNLNRLRQELRDIELQAEAQRLSRVTQAKDPQADVDPLAFDLVTRLQELTRMVAESVNDVATVQRSLLHTLEATEDDLVDRAHQARTLRADSAAPQTPQASGVGALSALSAPVLPAAAAQMPLILLVDDSITVRRVTQRLLQRTGYRVVLAADGLQALERLQEERPAVVLLDIEMPRMNGFDLARNIRGDARLKDLPIIMITACLTEQHREQAKQLGVAHCVGKPYAEDQLMRLLRHYCGLEAPAQVFSGVSGIL